MIPRVHITKPSGTPTRRDLEGVFGTGNEFVDEAESPRDVFRHRHDHEESPVKSRRSEDDFTVETPLWEGEDDGGIGEGKEWTNCKEEERWKWWKIYAMHFLFSWNSKTFEYVSIFLVALAFPQSLFATSIRGITSTVSGLLCSSAVGNWIDRTEVFGALTTTTILNHMAIIASYICWTFWPVVAGNPSQTTDGPFANLPTGALYGVLLLLDVVHDLSAIGNRLCLERNLVPTLIGSVTLDMKYDLTQVNAVMTRLELLVNLIAPSLLAFLMSSFGSRTGWLLLLTGTTVILFIIELYLVIKVIAIKVLEQNIETSSDIEEYNENELLSPLSQLRFGALAPPPPQKTLFSSLFEVPAARLRHYFSVPMWPASITVALLHLTVLAYSATLITYLMELGFSVTSVTIARASGAVTALAGTVITPVVVKYLRKRSGGDGDGRIKRMVGFGGIAEQFLCLIPVSLLLFNLSPTPTVPTTKNTPLSSPHPIHIPLLLFTLLSLSRIGHFGAILMVQELGQSEIPASQRSTFAGTEQSFKSMAELCHWGATMVWSAPDQFRWLAIGSVVVCGVGVGIWGWWARKDMRGEREGFERVELREW